MNAVLSWLRGPFRLLDSKKARWQLVIFCGIFGCLFLNIFGPFNISDWFQGVETPLFFILTFFSAAGMAALALNSICHPFFISHSTHNPNHFFFSQSDVGDKKMGKSIYQSICGSCHGPNASGNVS